MSNKSAHPHTHLHPFNPQLKILFHVQPAPAKRKKKAVVEVAAVSTVVSAGTVEKPKPAAPKPTSETGPRTAGARRSSEKKRGKRRRSSKQDSSFE
jgi:hypothetical protein